MNRTQKISVFTIIIFSIACTCAAVAVTILYHKVGWPVASAGFGLMGICGFAGLAPLFFKKEPGKITYDERDKMINRTAATGAFACSYIWLVIWGTILLTYDAFDAEFVKKTGLSILIFGAMMIVFVVHSLAVFIMYGKGGGDE